MLPFNLSSTLENYLISLFPDTVTSQVKMIPAQEKRGNSTSYGILMCDIWHWYACCSLDLLDKHFAGEKYYMDGNKTWVLFQEWIKMLYQHDCTKYIVLILLQNVHINYQYLCEHIEVAAVYWFSQWSLASSGITFLYFCLSSVKVSVLTCWPRFGR